MARELSERLKIKDHALAHSVWFELLTNEQYYKSCQKVNNFALRFLNRSLNDAVVEVEVSNLKETSSDKRKLLQKNTEMLNFVSTNGPHPLVCMDVVDCFLTISPSAVTNILSQKSLIGMFVQRKSCQILLLRCCYCLFLYLSHCYFPC